MDGVRILNQVEMREVNPLVILVGIGVMVIIVGLCLVFTEAIKDNVDKNRIAIGLVIFVVGVIIISFGIYFDDNPIPTGKYEYTVLLEKGVDLIEFSEKYEIVEKQGEMWIIKDK